MKKRRRKTKREGKIIVVQQHSTHERRYIAVKNISSEFRKNLVEISHIIAYSF